ncbi:MAG: lon [Acidimicrobiales bacterium]|jgi:ATP-dependent Lon protease|nr:lon [Acidimicrobiales bacterium]
MAETTAPTLPLLPLNAGVVLPGIVVTVAIDSDEAKAAVAAAVAGDGHLVLVPNVDGRFAKVGTVAKVETTGELPGGISAVLVRGVHRAVLGAAEPDGGNGLLRVHAEASPDGPPTDRVRELSREYRAVVAAVAEKRGSRRLPEALRSTSEPGPSVDIVTSSWTGIPIEQAIAVLEAVDVEQRLEVALEFAREALAELDVAERIRNDVAEGMDKAQRDFLLRQQMAAIRKELGEDGEDDAVGGYRARIEGLDMPPAVREAVEREIDRLERTNGQSPEQSWIRTWLDWLTELPWGVKSEDTADVNAARAVLDADHTGLTEVKDRIVEELAVRARRRLQGSEASGRRGDGLILALVGPPGVGKTSLGESVARALGRTFVRVALGGVRDEAEIRGHRRTYVGAQPGRIARAMKEAGTMNPVLLLDEVDKLGNDWRGDPSSALLEVLDPAQNHTFRDHYLEVDLDLSDVLFIATANVAETIPGPLLDRMEVVRLDGYTEDEKLAIATGHLLQRQRERNGLTDTDVVVEDDAIRQVIADYTREAGVRSLERELGKLLRKVTARLADGSATAPVTVGVPEIRGHLGRPKFFAEAADRTSVPGVATGLAVTGAGGDVLFVEATAMATAEPGGGALTVTGQLGDVMKESASIALSFVRSHAIELGLSDEAFAGERFHIHFPAGAVPKDGPSAGVTMTTALVSLLTGRPVKSTVGMTGEVTLSGRVLPIGGVKQKVLAAHRAGLTEVVLPARNGPDLEDVPEAVRDAITFHLVDDVREVVKVALEPATAAVAAA